MEKEKKLNEALERECIVAPKQAMGKFLNNDILEPIFSILPLFYEEDRRNTIILTEKEMTEHLFFTDKLLLKNINYPIGEVK